MILSGMSDFQQLQENIHTFETDQPLQKEEMDTVLAIADEMLGKTALPCTACHYCVSHCPKQLDIPSLLDLYNEHCFTGGGFLAPMALMAPVLAAAAVRLYVRSRLRFQRRWRILLQNWKRRKNALAKRGYSQSIFMLYWKHKIYYRKE